MELAISEIHCRVPPPDRPPVSVRTLDAPTRARAFCRSDLLRARGRRRLATPVASRIEPDQERRAALCAPWPRICERFAPPTGWPPCARSCWVASHSALRRGLRRCVPPGMRCGSVTVPLDRQNPSAGTIDIHYALVAHTDATRPAVGTIVANPGRSRDGDDRQRGLLPPAARTVATRSRPAADRSPRHRTVGRGNGRDSVAYARRWVSTSWICGAIRTARS